MAATAAGGARRGAAAVEGSGGLPTLTALDEELDRMIAALDAEAFEKYVSVGLGCGEGWGHGWRSMGWTDDGIGSLGACPLNSRSFHAPTGRRAPSRSASTRR